MLMSPILKFVSERLIDMVFIHSTLELKYHW